jgi:hypothetical protein
MGPWTWKKTGFSKYQLKLVFSKKDLWDRVVLGLEKTQVVFSLTGVPSPRTPCPPTCVCRGALVVCAAEYPERRGASCGFI